MREDLVFTAATDLIAAMAVGSWKMAVGTRAIINEDY
jgi:hypothetical protein